MWLAAGGEELNILWRAEYPVESSGVPSCHTQTTYHILCVSHRA